MHIYSWTPNPVFTTKHSNKSYPLELRWRPSKAKFHQQRLGWDGTPRTTSSTCWLANPQPAATGSSELCLLGMTAGCRTGEWLPKHTFSLAGSTGCVITKISWKPRSSIQRCMCVNCVQLTCEEPSDATILTGSRHFELKCQKCNKNVKNWIKW